MSIIHADGKNIYKEIQTNNTVIIDCWAQWCPPCKMLEPVLDEIDHEFELKIVKVNTDDNEDFTSEFQILSIPTILIFQNEKLIDRITGYQSKEILMEFLKKNGIK